MEIRLAGTGDTAGWLALVEQVRDSFPGLESREAMEEHRKTVLAFLARDEAICAVDGGRLVGRCCFPRRRECSASWRWMKGAAGGTSPKAWWSIC